MLRIPYTTNLLVSIQYPGQAAHAHMPPDPDLPATQCGRQSEVYEDLLLRPVLFDSCVLKRNKEFVFQKWLSRKHKLP